MGVFNIGVKRATHVAYIHLVTNNRHRLSFPTSSYIFHDRSQQKLTGWPNTVFTSLWGPEWGDQKSCYGPLSHWPRNYAAVDTSCSGIFSSTTRHRIWSHRPWNALYCKGCSPWEKTLKFEFFCENRKTDAGSDDKLWIQFAPPYETILFLFLLPLCLALYPCYGPAQRERKWLLSSRLPHTCTCRNALALPPQESIEYRIFSNKTHDPI